ncbi:ABC transporter ATP-binding protein [Longimicrobium sp.]|uniref:ABC transporter ATP-binding protein n=1 Tax=Longimicrobium sp. TaxID=2029185 RepID=UPI002C73BD8A|nr:ABC transporter ATP-binding protein [Longimicrobium sp.]HSU14830.1 ABC transporter ATP-binding protein [Longimicrobium sp.]
MRESWRALLLLVRTAWRADRRRSAGLLLEPVGFLRYPLFGWFLGMMADGALRHDARGVAAGAAGIAATRVLAFAGEWTGAWIRNRLIEEVGFALDREIALLVSELPGLEHHERPDYQDRLELLRQQQGLLGGSLNALIYTANVAVGALGTLVGLALVHPWLLLLVPFALPALPIATLTQRWLARAEARSAAPARRARHLQALTVDRNAGMELRVFGLQREVLARFGAAWTEARRPAQAVAGRAALLNGAGDLVFVAGFTGAVALMLWRASLGRATAGEVVMAVYLAQQVRASIAQPIRLVAGLGETLRAGRRMLWLQDYARDAARAAPGTRPAPGRLADGIVFENVSFRYPGTERWALRDVSFRIPAGCVIALVGENGAGKTTLVKLLCRMYEPTEGRILVDGVDLADIEAGAWRSRLSAAFQDFARFELTAQHTVGVGDLSRVDDRDAAGAALERAGAGGVLGALPAGLGAQLGARWEGGVDLSTGQWQKLALGRALMRRDPLVVFFDEPTASLDALAEHALFERYAREARSGAARGAVTVLVSHRFSTVRSADLILVIDGGGVTELGGHDELLMRDGLYAELYTLQARSYA